MSGMILNSRPGFSHLICTIKLRHGYLTIIFRFMDEDTAVEGLSNLPKASEPDSILGCMTSRHTGYIGCFSGVWAGLLVWGKQCIKT